MSGEKESVSSGTQSESTIALKSKKHNPFKKDKKSQKVPNEKISDKNPALDPYRNVPENQVEALKVQTETPAPKVSVFTLFKFANKTDTLILLAASFFAVLAGVAQPMFTFVVGGITNNFTAFAKGDISPAQFQHIVNHNVLYFIYIGAAITVCAFGQAFLFNNRGEVIAGRYRKEYLRAAIRQNIGYFDHLGAGSVSTRITNDTASVQGAISDMIGQIIKAVATFVAAVVVALVTEWKLALIGLTAVVWFIVIVMANGAMFGKFTGIAMSIYAKGSNVAEESLSAARNTIALSAQERMAKKFDAYLEKTYKTSRRASLHMSLLVTTMWSTLAFLYALVIWQGSRMVKSGEASVGHIITVMVSLLIGMFNLGSIAPQIRNLATGIAAAKNLNETLTRVPCIDAGESPDHGSRLSELKGSITLKNVQFRYPSRPDVLVLPDFSLDIAPGQTVALVGESGSGKSTVVGLLERFYSPLEGQITVDGTNIEEFNIKWLRQQIGLVSQEPTLFASSIAENISYGLIGTPYEHASEQEKQELIIDACKQANAWDFIQTLDQGLETNVGERGFLLSGGQKQRIAIARAIVSNPKILLLDEATSALDTKSEGIVQEALDRAAESRTTIVVAHRLSTIKNADKIVVMKKGVVTEQGTHSELISQGGLYARLVELQSVEQGEDGATNLVRKEDDFVETTDDFVPPPIPGSENRKSRLIEIVQLLLRFNKDQRGRLIFAAVFSITVGYAQVAYAMLLGKTMQSLMVNPDMYDQMRHEVNKTSGFMFMVGMHQAIVGFLVMYALTSASDYLLHNVRLAMFKQMMRMDISFFDLEKHSPGALIAILARDGKAIEGFGGATVAQLIQCVVTIIGGAVTGIAFNWRLGLVGTACYPIILSTGFLRIKILGILERRNNAVFEKSGALATSFTNAIRTIQSLTRETQVCDEYDSLINKQVSDSFRDTLGASFIYGICEGMFLFILALIWHYGSKLLSEGKISVFGYFVVFLGTVIGGNSAVMVFNFVPDLGSAKRAASNVLRMLEAKPNIDSQSTEGAKADHVKGQIKLKDVYFRYPTRPEVPVLRGINVTVEPGQSVAFVGASGCGKSTTVGLIERFYDPDNGTLFLDGVDFKDYNVMNLRQHISLVQQEPILYSGSIRDNLMLGWPGDASEVSQEDLERICQDANIHEFIMSLPDGYETDVGGHGVLLSGGQKQRIAIARALLKNPAVLLLDEATSALDAESEKVVQAAIDKASKGRTTISIAHRLSTIQNCDVIYVFDKGRIAEKGSHHELLAINGIYAELVHLQSLAR